SGGVLSGEPLAIKFNERVKALDGIVKIYRKSDNTLLQELNAENGKVAPDGLSLRLGLSSTLPVGELMTFKLSDDVVYDNGFNRYESNQEDSWDFMIVTSRPTIESLSPADGDLFVPGSTLEITYTGPVFPS
ncbi:unnamed protein product, partial [Discosporangium mesarthrocarpum]